MIDQNAVLKRFLTYVKIDTQSSETSDTYPSTMKQLDLCKLLVKELQGLGLADVELTKDGYVFATLPATTEKQVSVIGFIAHVDTSPDVSGANIKPIIHKNYQGGDIVLPEDKSHVITFEKEPDLQTCIGHDIVTTDGMTLLGADDKAGIAAIMSAMEYLVKNPEMAHGMVRIAFTVDEEVGTGTKYFDVKNFGAEYAYTVDGGALGELETETFCADSAIVKIKGVNVHPGYAKGKLLNGIKILSQFITMLPENSMSPETTEGREGYLHPHGIKGSVEESEIVFLVRDFTEEGLKEKEALLEDIMGKLADVYSQASLEITISESYRNMKAILDQHPKVVDLAEKAMQRAGVTPRRNIIRGGTDGARLCYMGLPTPNLFAGGHNFHSKKEWISVQDMVKASETIVHLCHLWAEEGE
jgi:tripeptide aminopeptidase